MYEALWVYKCCNYYRSNWISGTAHERWHLDVFIIVGSTVIFRWPKWLSSNHLSLVLVHAFIFMPHLIGATCWCSRGKKKDSWEGTEWFSNRMLILLNMKLCPCKHMSAIRVPKSVCWAAPRTPNHIQPCPCTFAAEHGNNPIQRCTSAYHACVKLASMAHPLNRA